MTMHYPKMLVVDGKPAIYRPGHERQGEMVIFQSADEESAFDKTIVVPADGRPEQHSQPQFVYEYQPPLWTRG
jgi:hypothetical protein